MNWKSKSKKKILQHVHGDRRLRKYYLNIPLSTAFIWSKIELLRLVQQSKRVEKIASASPCRDRPPFACKLLLFLGEQRMKSEPGSPPLVKRPRLKGALRAHSASPTSRWKMSREDNRSLPLEGITWTPDRVILHRSSGQQECLFFFSPRRAKWKERLREALWLRTSSA